MSHTYLIRVLICIINYYKKEGISYIDVFFFIGEIVLLYCKKSKNVKKSGKNVTINTVPK